MREKWPHCHCWPPMAVALLDGWTTSTLQRMMGHCVIWWARRIIQMEEPGDAFGTFL